MTETSACDSTKPDTVKIGEDETCSKGMCDAALDEVKAPKPEAACCSPAKGCGDEAHPYFNDELRTKAKKPTGLYVGLVIVVALASMLYANKDLLIQPDALVMPEALDLVARADALEKRVAILEKQLEPVAGKSSAGVLAASQVPAPSALGEGEVAALRDGLVGLTQGLSALQTRLEESAKEASENRANAQSGIATVLAFTQMQRKALAGMPFENERQLLRTLAAHDVQEVEGVNALEALALTGAPTYAALQKEWRKQAAEAQAVLRKVGAHTWFDRLIVALEGLVSIRSLNPQAGDMLSFAAVELDLERGEVWGARKKVQAMPPEVQAVLKDWLAQLDRRIDLETKFDQLTTYLIAKGTPAGLVPTSTDEVMPEAVSSEPEKANVTPQPSTAQETLAEPVATPETGPVDKVAPAAPAESRATP